MSHEELIELYPEINMMGYPGGSVEAPPKTAALTANSVGEDPWKRPRESFVNWETAHVHPLDKTPDGNRLLAVNTADNSLLVFDISANLPQQIARIPVGLEPVSVRARSNTEAWVVNHLSDSVSVVDLTKLVVERTLQTEDEPADVVFAGTPAKAYVSCSQVNRVNVFTLSNLDAAPKSIFINGEDPRALAVSPDGSSVYAAVFESGNASTLVNGGTANRVQVDYVSRTDGPYGGQNPPPNDGNSFSPAINPSSGAPPPISQIVRKDAQGRWMDDNGGDWSLFVTGNVTGGTAAQGERVRGWDLKDRDVAVIDTSTDQVSTYHSGLMTTLMAMGVNPVSGEMFVVGTDATNEIRFEPNLRGRFLKVLAARVSEDGDKQLVDLNPHINYDAASLPAAQRTQSIGDPRGVYMYPNGRWALVTGMGSNNLLVLGSDGRRVHNVPVGEGPTGVVVANDLETAYVLNKFEGSISVLNARQWVESTRVPFFDPTPGSIKKGRKFFYDTHLTSGQGQISCASCHIDGRSDRLAWDLGDPSKGLIDVNDRLHHPMKGPMLTQTLQDAMRHPLMHWRGDVIDLAHGFSITPFSLQGADRAFSAAEIESMETFLDSIHLPPNPNRNLDNTFKTELDIPGPNNTIARTGNAELGAQEFERDCRNCHPGNVTRGSAPLAAFAFGLNQLRLAPSWRGFHERFGLWFDSADGSNAGFGIIQNGSFDSTHNKTRSADMMAFMQSVTGRFPYVPRGLSATNQSQDTHAAVGQQVHLSGMPTADKLERLAQLMELADRAEIGLSAQVFGLSDTRSLAYRGGDLWQGEFDHREYLSDDLIAAVTSNAEPLLVTAVPTGTEMRSGVDFDSDGALNGDELAAGTDPLDADSFPAPACDALTLVSEGGGVRQSTGWQGDAYPAVFAIDGDPNTFNHTSFNEENPTLWLDLNASYTLARIDFFNRSNCCPERMRDLELTLFNSDGTMVHQQMINPGNQLGSPSVVEHVLSANPRARYLRLIRRPAADLTGVSAVALQLGELKVYACGVTNSSPSIVNKATAGTATQSSTSYGGVAARAIDGNTSGLHRDASVSHTAFQNQPWWQLDLGTRLPIEELVVYNRSDCCGSRLADAHVFVSDSDMSALSLQQLRDSSDVWEIFIDGALPRKREITVGQSGRFVRIQLSGRNYLSLAEVQVLVDEREVGANRAPLLAPIGAQIGEVGDELSLALNGSDPDVDRLSYAATGLPDGLSLNANTGAITGTATRAGVFAVAANVSDGTLSARRDFTWVISETAVGTRLENNVALSGTVAQGEWAHYRIDSGDTDAFLSVALSGLSADVDLYVRAGAAISGDASTDGVYDCESVLGSTSDENCVLPSSGSTRWFVSVYGYQAGSFNINATLSSANNSGAQLVSGQPVDGIVSKGEWHFFSYTGTGSAADVSVTLNNNSADVDLYVRATSEPDLSNFDCRSFNSGTSDENCVLGDPGSTVWQIGIYGYETGSYTLSAITSTTRLSNAKDFGRSKVSEAVKGGGGGAVSLLGVVLLMSVRRFRRRLQSKR